MDRERWVWQHVGNEAKETADVGAPHTVRNKPLREDGKRCDGYSCLSTGLHLVLTQTQAAGHTCEKLFWIELFEVETSHLSLHRWRSEVPHTAVSAHRKRYGRRKTVLPCFPSMSLARSFIRGWAPLADSGPTSGNVQHHWKQSEASSLKDWKTIRFWAFLSGDNHSL